MRPRWCRPALAAGRYVVSDRFAGSSMAYQGYGRGLPPDEVRRLSGWATDGLWPDLVVLLEVPGGRGRRTTRAASSIASSRRATTSTAGWPTGFRALADADPHHWEVVDGTGTIDEVEHRVRAAVAQRLQLEA